MTAHTPDDLLAATVDGTLSEADRHAVETHLRTCARCRDQVEAAGRARAVLKALPAELAPPIEVAAAVAARIGSGRATVVARPAASDRHTAAAPRWYRAAGLVAAAAAIALAVLVIPNLTDRGDPSQDTRALDAASQEAGASAGVHQGAAASPTVPVVEFLGTELDHDSLVDLGREAQRPAGDATAVPTLSSPPSGTPAPSGDEALACLRAGAGGVLSIQARVVRLLSAPFEGTPAFVAIAVTDPSEDATDIQIVVVAVAADSCRFLDSA